MIATLSGTVAVREASRVVIETGGVGYEVFIPLSTYYRLPGVGEQVRLEIRQIFRDDGIMLYGFSEPGEKRAFDLLTSIQHVGPRHALSILSVLTVDELVSAIAHDDVERIDAVPGVGPKVAERLVRELRDRVSELRLAGPGVLASNGAPRAGRDGAGGSRVLDDAISALINLGIKPAEAKQAVDSVAAHDSAAAEDLEVVIRKSLAVLLGEK
ncbi:MAG TPA: Holliday junction branch migration protein RuvA [Candidatus Binataceae bacterium]|nr:Holliday junction branch migration protein RuvA [Candidatus Binataceae bacterium]